MYRFTRKGATVQIEGNQGTVILTASSPRDALKGARRIFPHMRDVGVRGTAGRYFVEFKVDPDHNRELFDQARRLGKLELTRQNYEELEPLEKYMALLYAQLAGKETFLENPMQLRAAVPALENELLRKDVVSSRDDLMDYEIAVYNAVESQSQP